MENYEHTPIIIEAQKQGSLEIISDYWVYPEGHAIAVFVSTGDQSGKLSYYNSFIGVESIISVDLLSDCL